MQEFRFEGSLHRELRHQTKVFVMWMIASKVALASAIIVAVKLL